MPDWLRKVNTKLFSFYFIALFFLFWEAAPRLGWANAQFVPPLSVVLAEGWKIVRNGEMFIHISISLQRTFLGFLFALAAGLPLGFILGGWLPRTARFLRPLMNFLAQINSMTLFPLFLVLFGLGEAGKVSIILWAAFWPILFTTMSGVQQMDPLYIKCARSMGTSGVGIFFKIVLPGASAQILAGVRTGITMSFMMLIGAEMVGANMGLGWLVHNAEANYVVPRMYVGLLTIALFGLGIHSFMQWLEKNIITWKEAGPEQSV